MPEPTSFDPRARFLANEYVELWKDSGVESHVLTAERLAARVAPAPAPAPAPPRADTLEAIREALGDCQRCGLCGSRTKIVFGSGNPRARLAFVADAPRAEDDSRGLPFLGPPGQLLTKIIEAMGYARDQVYLANVVKCRPPADRAASTEEIATCLPFLRAQLGVVGPRVVVALGEAAAAALLGPGASLAERRGRFHPLADSRGIVVMPTYPPDFLLANPGAKKLVWEDMKLVRARLEAAS